MKLDQLNDQSNIQLFRLLSGVELPEFVKDAEVDSDATVSGLEKSAFADEVNFAYPIDTPARVYVSNAFFQAKKAELTQRYGSMHTENVAAKIAAAAELFSISAELTNFNELTNKRANHDLELRHVCEVEEGTALFPYKTAAEFSQSAQVFANNIGKYPFDWREKIAKAFLAQSAEVGVDELPDLVCKYAGLFFPIDTASMSNELARRANKMSSKTAAERLTQLSQAVDGLEFDSIEDVMKVARIVHHTELEDGAYGRPKTAELLPDPVGSLFAVSPIKVAGLLNVVDMAGEKYRMDALTKVSAHQYKEAFGIDIDPTNEEALRTILPTMPLSDVTLFRDLTGVEPI